MANLSTIHGFAGGDKSHDILSVRLWTMGTILAGLLLSGCNLEPPDFTATVNPKFKIDTRSSNQSTYLRGCNYGPTYIRRSKVKGGGRVSHSWAYGCLNQQD